MDNKERLRDKHNQYNETIENAGNKAIGFFNKVFPEKDYKDSKPENMSFKGFFFTVLFTFCLAVKVYQHFTTTEKINIGGMLLASVLIILGVLITIKYLSSKINKFRNRKKSLDTSTDTDILS